MNRSCFLAQWLVLTPLLVAPAPAVPVDKNAAPLDKATTYLESASAAEGFMIHEGLPHQIREPKVLARELERDDTGKIWSFPFYTPAVNATNPDDLRKLLSDPSMIRQYSGPKTCGGYHPDYAISWKAGERTHYAMICFGCNEVVFFDGKTAVKYDLTGKIPYEAYTKHLARYENKRPEKKYLKQSE
jgi:hypothetical protein